MPKVRLEVFSPRVIADLLGDSRAAPGEKFTIADGATISLAPPPGGIQGRAQNAPIAFIIMTAASIPTGVIAGVIGNWLYDKLFGRGVSHVLINRKVVELDRGEIARIIEESIEIDE